MAPAQDLKAAAPAPPTQTIPVKYAPVSETRPAYFKPPPPDIAPSTSSQPSANLSNPPFRKAPPQVGEAFPISTTKPDHDSAASLQPHFRQWAARQGNGTAPDVGYTGQPTNDIQWSAAEGRLRICSLDLQGICQNGEVVRIARVAFVRIWMPRLHLQTSRSIARLRSRRDLDAASIVDQGLVRLVCRPGIG